jgi:hypothetical protein
VNGSARIYQASFFSAYFMVHYTGRMQEGTVFDTSEGREPLEMNILSTMNHSPRRQRDKTIMICELSRML